jgi:hypothetical protein
MAGGFLIAIFFFCHVVKKGSEFYATIGDEVFKLFLLGTYIVLPGTTVKIFQTFRCVTEIAMDGDDAGGRSNNADYGTFLKADLNKRCYTTTYEYDTSSDLDRFGVYEEGSVDLSYEIDPTYQYYVYYAIAMIFVFPVGITCLYAVSLYVTERAPPRKSFGFAELTLPHTTHQVHASVYHRSRARRARPAQGQRGRRAEGGHPAAGRGPEHQEPSQVRVPVRGVRAEVLVVRDF